ncbi:uncharacterized protein [Drosophila tropicalis]|uniref:uncharacterized protein n=1 Tax=Drosophila tropicalis TaxID=46794 RepID=UPI0035AC02C6
MARHSNYFPELDMSLDEIIQSKKQLHREYQKPSNWQRTGHQKWKKSSFPPGFDAREVILQKQRARITDAREIISRKRLHHELGNLSIDETKNKKQKTDSLSSGDDLLKRPLTIENHRRANSMRREVFNYYVDYDDMSHLEAEEQRTRLLISKSTKKSSTSRSINQKRIQAPPRDDDDDLFLNRTVKCHFQSQYLEDPVAPAQSFRVLVSNLASNVTTHDIKELFVEFGAITDAAVIRQGTAEVFYKSLKDAEKAVHYYHNRYFDNKPMHCVLVPPPHAKRCVLSNGSRAGYKPNHPDAVDLDAVHYALFGDT